jgi:transcriptional regulator
MYTPRYFAETDLALLDSLACEHPFATLITIFEGEPCITHLPVLYQRDGNDVTVRGHWSRANPQWRHGGEARLILHGPQAYISPSWYPDKVEEARVPTWNYTVAHLAGPLEIIEDEVGLAAIVSELTSSHEAEVGSDWRFEFEDPALRSQLRGIIGFRMPVSRIEVKFKLNQNHPPANVTSVANELARGDENDKAISALMLQQLSRKASKEGA